MSNDIGGYDPVATLEERNSNVYQFAESLASGDDDDFALVSFVHGDVYIAEVVDDPQEAYYTVVAEITEGMTGDEYGSTDQWSEDLGDSIELVDELATTRRFVVENYD